MDQKETYKPAFTTSPGGILAGISTEHLHLPSPYVSYGLQFSESCAKHVKETFRAERIYIICSGSLARNTDNLNKLIDALGEDRVVGTRKGMTPHSLWSEILEIVQECKNGNVDCLVTLGAGTLTDAAKIVVLVHSSTILKTDCTKPPPVPCKRHPHPRPTLPLHIGHAHTRINRPPTNHPPHNHPHQPLRRRILPPRRRNRRLDLAQARLPALRHGFQTRHPRPLPLSHDPRIPLALHGHPLHGPLR